MSEVPVITIDGPSGSGKGTVSRAVARALGWGLLDSGALYRLVALAARRTGVALDDVEALSRLAARFDIRFGAGPRDEEIVWLDGKDVMIRGFMVPVKDVQGHSTEFLIVRDQPTCCYSGMTTITEFVSVKVPGQGVESILDQPITVQGKLHIGAMLESGYVLGVYRMEGEKLVDPPKSRTV